MYLTQKEKELIKLVVIMNVEDISKIRMGISPDEIKEIVQNLKEKGLIDTIGTNIITNKILEINDYDNIEIDVITKYKEYQKKLPDPHAHHYDWRFKLVTMKKILKKIQKDFYLDSKDFCFICSPHLGMLFNLLHPQIPITIVDNNHEILSIIEKYKSDNALLVECDIRTWNQSVPKIHLNKYNLVFFDPPLYYDYYETILNICKKIMSNRAKVYMVMYNHNIKNNLYEKMLIYRMITDLSLLPIEICKNILDYEVPAFEAKTYESQGICNIIDWRKHELLILENVTSKNELPNYVEDNENGWKQYVFNKKTIYLRKEDKNSNDYNKPIFNSIYSDNSSILKSVSRRHLPRKKINYWTSDNYVFNIENIHIVSEILDIISHKSRKEILNILSKKYKVPDAIIKDDLSDVIDTIVNHIE